MAGVPNNFKEGWQEWLIEEYEKYHRQFARDFLMGLNPLWNPPNQTATTAIWHPPTPQPTQVKAYAHNQPKQRRPDEAKPTDDERRAEEMKRFLDGKRTAPDRHAEGCECWKCKPSQW